MAMTGVRARRVDDAEVKLDTAFYRLRERFFGSRVGSLAFSAVAFNLGTNRGMVCVALLAVSASDASLAGGTGAFSPRVVERAFEMSCTSRSAFVCDLRTARRQSRSSFAPAPRSQLARRSKRGTGGMVRGGL